MKNEGLREKGIDTMEQQNNQYEYSYNEQGCEGENGISYVLGITECISYKQFRDIVVTIIKELRSIQGEFLVVNVYCPNPAGIHFLQVCANDDNSYELEICKEVKDSIVFGEVLVDEQGKCTKIYCHNRNNTDMDKVIEAFEDVLVDGIFPDMDWVDITSEAKSAIRRN